MQTFEDFNLSKQLQYAIADLGFKQPTAIQAEAFPIILAGKNVVGISQTGTGKTLAFMLPLLQGLAFSKQIHPRILVLVPTRELVLQTVEQIQLFAKYLNLRVLGVYGGTNINTQQALVAQGTDILVATPGRLYDLALNGPLKLKTVSKIVIDEVDVMLDLGFRFQLTNIFELLPERRQNVMFSATMTEEVEELIDDYFIAPEKIAIAVSGTPLENIAQSAYLVENFYTKANLLAHLLKDKTVFNKVLVFVDSKKNADRLYDYLATVYGAEMAVIHSNKSQNYRIRSVQQFENGKNRILIASDIIARGLDLDKVSHVINMDVPKFPENYMHRIGRTGRAEQEGNAILFYTKAERLLKEQVELLMAYEIPEQAFPETVEVATQLLPEERKDEGREKNYNRNIKTDTGGGAFHEKKEKNRKENLGGSYRRELAKKYKKPKTRGDKLQNIRKKK